MKVDRISGLLASLVFVALSGGSTAWATKTPTPQSPPVPADQFDIMNSGSGLGGMGQYLGTVVEMNCDIDRPAGTAAECDASGHYYVLLIDGRFAVYTLIPGTQEIRDKLVSGKFTGREAWVTGSHYSLTGTILAGNIRPRSNDDGFGRPLGSEAPMSRR
jgi:hypothetical protein